jgi:putative PIN family toxin of toxin-antitoxin system
MQNNILDTNILVSSLIQKSYPYHIIYDLFVEDKFNLCVSEKLLQEYDEVLKRPKFSQYHDFYARAESLLGSIIAKAKIFTPQKTIDLISDKSDNMLLELADECLADFIITGNINDFTFPQYKNTKIVTPKEYWEQFLDIFKKDLAKIAHSVQQTPDAGWPGVCCLPLLLIKGRWQSA